MSQTDNIDSRSAILVVEDDIPTQEFMRAVLKREFDIYLATSADEAREVLKANTIHIILMDLSIHGGENGLDLTKNIRNGSPWKDIPIIALTAHAFQSDRDNAMEAGCDEFITKPFNLNELIKLMRSYIAKMKAN